MLLSESENIPLLIFKNTEALIWPLGYMTSSLFAGWFIVIIEDSKKPSAPFICTFAYQACFVVCVLLLLVCFVLFFLSLQHIRGVNSHLHIESEKDPTRDG